MKNKQKEVIVLMSGGLDSTYLVYKNLKEGNIVYPIYNIVENNKQKSNLEQQQINNLINEFRGEFGWDNLKNISLPININLDYRWMTSPASLTQPLIWILGAIFSLDSTKNISEIHIGYVIRDDAISFIDDIKKLYRSYKPFLQENYKLPVLKFPLIKYDKKTLYNSLPKNYIMHCVACENPNIFKTDFEKDKTFKFEICGNCVPCKRYERELDIIDNEQNLVKIVKNNEGNVLPKSNTKI